ncbi:MAG: sigma-70 family RNA polymerase sigma factor, partial [Candidatus Omnitrophica bacterium]|nr:sigma-70 family RNA polymerase sigma factor [Candidatus Omnitrophota bacterium]
MNEAGYSAIKNEDVLLIEAFNKGDQASFDKLVIKYKNKIFNLCFRFLNNYEEADDCAQEAFVKVFRSLSGFKFESSFSTWIYRVAVNTCKNKVLSSEFRQRKKMIRIDSPANDPKDGDRPLEIGDEKYSPRKAAQDAERSGFISEAIASLPDDQKQVIILRDIEGLSYDEIATVTGFNLGTVKSRISRARQTLCEMLRGRV